MYIHLICKEKIFVLWHAGNVFLIQDKLYDFLESRYIYIYIFFFSQNGHGHLDENIDVLEEGEKKEDSQQRA